jgi:hypothetical protein
MNFPPGKGAFFALAASTCGLACAAYRCTPPRDPLVFLPEQKIPVSESETSV